MSILADHQIAKLCESKLTKPMIKPFTPFQVRTILCSSPEHEGKAVVEKKAISYGLSSFGYDVILDKEFKIFSNINSTIIDPLDFDQNCCVDHTGDFVIIPPNSYVLGKTKEYFVIPKDIMVVCVGKSTYARVGAIVNVTPIEAGFEGNVVIEISNATNLPLKVYANQGIAQFLFFKGDSDCTVSYADGNRKYQGQNTLQTALV
jgi:dCTP deaminase